MTELVKIPFHGTNIVADGNHDEPLVVIRPICESLGIDHSTQMRKLKNKPWATVVNLTTVADDGRRREMSMVNRKTLTMWLATIDARKVRSGAQELLGAFQNEAADVLDAYFNEGAAPVNTRFGLPDLSGMDPSALALIGDLSQKLGEVVKVAQKHQVKAEQFDTWLNNKAGYKIGSVGKTLGVGQNTLFRFLREQKVLITGGARHNEPYANPKYAGWFEVKPYDLAKTNGHARMDVRLTPLGMVRVQELCVKHGLVQNTLIAIDGGRAA